MPRTTTISLPVLKAAPTKAPRPEHRWSKAARWRTGSLIVVHLLILAHMLHWWITGRSFGRVVFSDSMRTLELGEINPGFILFASVLVATALFGRFFCGWLCHMGALQDLCAWLLRRVGVRPRLFRSRLLGFVPLALALYMFVWPTFHREALAPVLGDFTADFLQTPPPFPGLSYNLSTRHIWEGLPSVWVAIPFLLLCGFGTVYFLGARGLCRYGCPYGGFLLPVEQLAPARVVVDPAKCDQCGLCTKACTTGVRVHDEVRLYQAVTDRNCIKSFDCIEACPSGALSFRATLPPSPFRKSHASYDLTWIEEIVCILACVGVFFVVRGLYGIIPLLLAATIAVLASFFTWKALRVAREPNVRLGAWILRKGSTLTRPGLAFLAGFAALTILFAHSAAIRGSLLLAQQADDHVNVPLQDALQGRASPEQAQHAASALRWYQLVRPIGQGGIGLASSPEVPVRMAWMQIVTGRPQDAESSLREALDDSPSDAVAEGLGTLLIETGRRPQAIALLQRHAAPHPSWKDSRRMLTNLLLGARQPEEAEQLHRDALAANPKDVDALLELGRVLIVSGRDAEGTKAVERAFELAPESLEAALASASVLHRAGRTTDAVALLSAYAKRWPATRRQVYTIGANMLASAGSTAQAAQWRDLAAR